MNNLLTRFTLGFGAIAMALLFTAGVQAQSASGPIFNNYSGVDGVGNEADFLRIRQTDGTKVDTVEACSGEVTIWFYVHNSQAAANNGTNNDGPGVAKGTRVKVAIPTGTSNTQTLKGTISATNAATVTDTTKITCGGKAVKLEYVSTDPVYTTAPGGYTLKGDITSATGAELGYNGGVLPGCWDYRAWITLKVRIVPEQPKVQTLVCDLLTVTAPVNRKVTASVKATATNGATISGYTIDFGDKTTPVSSQTASHTYAKDGTYTITGSVEGKVNGYKDSFSSKNCVKQVTIKTPPVEPPVEPPVTPPTELPDTGAGSVLGIFAAVTLAGAFGHRLWTIRKSNR